MTSNQHRRQRHALSRYGFWVACGGTVLVFSQSAAGQSAPDHWCPADTASALRPDTAGVLRADTALSPAKCSNDARLAGFIFPGGGQYYLGEYRHGAAVTAQSIALLGAGALGLVIDNCTFHFSDMGHCTPNRHFGQWAIGALVIAAGARVWARAALEAGRHAQAHARDTRSRTSLRPLIDVPRAGSVHLGFSRDARL